MTQQRINITYINGKPVSAELQEMEAFDTNGVVYWKTIRPLPVLNDGTILYSGGEPEPSNDNQLTDQSINR